MHQPQPDTHSYLVDAPIYVFRGYFSLPDSITDGDGHPVNALYGFAGFLADLIREARPRYLAAAFDESLTRSFRNEIFPAYKANRPPAPDDLKEQFRRCRELCRLLGIRELVGERWEADDYIGTMARLERAAGRRAVIVSRDKDLLQLLEDGDWYWDFAAGKRLDAAAVLRDWGVRPNQIADYLALVGDKVDNIPGVRGVGDKAARALLQRFETLDGVYAGIDEVTGLPVRGAVRLRQCLIDGEVDARLSRRLTAIPRDVPVSEADIGWRSPDLDAIEGPCRQLGLGEATWARLRDALAATGENGG